MSKVIKDLSQTKMNTETPTSGRKTAVTLEERVGEIRTSITQAISDRVFPGALFGVFQYREGRGETHLEAFGRHTYEPDSPEVTDQTFFDVASVTKSVPTSLLLLRKLNESEAFLDQKVRDSLPEFEGEYAKDVTLRHLLTFGIELNADLGFGFGPDRVKMLEDLGKDEIHRRIMQSGLKRPPGLFSYHNTTSYIATKLIERLYGIPYVDAASKYVLKPMGIEGGFLSELVDPKCVVPTEIQSGQLVHGVVQDEFTRALLSLGVASGAAGMFLSGKDGLRICRVMVGDKGSRLLPEREDRFPIGFSWLLPRNHLSGVDQKHRYGLGWDILGQNYLACGCGFHETILITGFSGCSITLLPRRGFGYFLFTNATFPQRPPKGLRGPLFHLRRHIHKTLVCGC